MATILKSPTAVETTLAIIDTFAKVRELSRVIHQVQALPENSPKQKSLMEHTGDLIADLLIPGDELEVNYAHLASTFISGLVLGFLAVQFASIGAHILNNTIANLMVLAQEKNHWKMMRFQQPQGYLQVRLKIIFS